MNQPSRSESAGSANGRSDIAAPVRRPRRLGPRVAGLLVGALLGLVLPVLVISLFRSGHQLPALTPERLEAARAAWQAHGPDSYEMEIRIAGRRPGTVRITVLDGEPVAMTRDGVTPKRRASWDAWTVPGMFDTLELELADADHPERGFGASPQARVVELARFDDRTGCPLEYQRYILGTPLDMSWQVTEFKALTAESAP